ncbi:MAG: polyamine aminopropyltransferase [Myxococcales bacterium]
MKTPLLFLTVLVIAACGLVYELVAGALASYLLGDSVLQFSTVIGAYLSALGLGAWLSRYLGDRELAARFVDVELAVALVGGASAPLLFLAFGRLGWFRIALYALVIVIGALVGLEVPLLLRILRQKLEFKELVARVLSVDYLGALVGSLLFPILLVPRLGLVRTSLAFGLLNGAVALWTTYLFGGELKRLPALRARCAVVLALLVAGLLSAGRLTSLAEDGMYADEIIFAKQSAYQRIVITRGRAGFQLFLDGNLQFASADEYRYHEALVHPAFAVAEHHAQVLVLGGGDGLAVREILRHPDVERVTLVDLDPAMTQLAHEVPPVRALNGDSLRDPRVRVINADAMAWLADASGLFDVAIVDFPDPNNFSLGKLYTTRFYALLRRHLAPGAAVAVQSTSPLFARRSFWCIATTMEQAGFAVRPYHAFVPSFGEWGFMLAKRAPFAEQSHVLAGKFLDDRTLPTLFALGPDLARVAAEPNRLDNQILVQYYEGEWRRWN